MIAVPLSGGWDSTYCLIKALRAHSKEEVTAVFFNYGQPYLMQEFACSKRIAESFGVRYLAPTLQCLPRVGVVFTGRNYTFMQHLKDLGAGEVWFGSRNLLWCMDRFGDSNWQWANLIGHLLGIRMRTPCTLRPKWWIKRTVRLAGIPDAMIYSTEGVHV